MSRFQITLWLWNMNYILWSILKKKKKSEGRIRMLNLTLKVLRSVVKGRNTGGYKSMPKNQLINLINH